MRKVFLNKYQAIRVIRIRRTYATTKDVLWVIGLAIWLSRGLLSIQGVVALWVLVRVIMHFYVSFMEFVIRNFYKFKNRSNNDQRGS